MSALGVTVCAALAALGQAAGSAPASQPAGKVEAKWVQLPGDAAQGPGPRLYVAYDPAAKTPQPGLILIHEWWGLNDDIQERTREFAARGYYTVAVDLYGGEATDDPAKAKVLKQTKVDNAEVRDAVLGKLAAATAYLLDQKAVDANRLGVAGWCMGGQLSLAYAATDDRMKACVVFYGGLITDPAALGSLAGPVLGIFGNLDRAPSPAEVDEFAKAMKEAGKQADIHRYDGVGHAFASKAAAKAGLYKPEQAAQAWAVCYAWLAQVLKPGT